MIRTVEQFAEEFIAPLGIKNPIRWVREHAAAGDIPAKCISRKRGLYLFTAEHVERWLNDDTPQRVPEDVPADPVSITDGLSARSRRRLSA